MGSDWQETTLGNILVLQRGFDLAKNKRTKGCVPIIASTGITGWHNEPKVDAPGVVIGRSGTIGGGQYIEGISFWPLNTTLWVKDFKGNSRRFCYYLLKSIDFHVFNVGSGVPTLNRNHIHPLPVLLPSLQEQKAIAHILGSLDDKIELNRQTNQTLEAMAQTLFKSWFVDFDPVIDNALAAGNPIPESLQVCAAKRVTAKQEENTAANVSLCSAKQVYDFPDEFEFNEEMGWIPMGWEVTLLENLTTISSSKRVFAKEYEKEGVPFYRGKEISLLSKGINITPEIFITKNRFDKIKEKYGVPLTGDILLTSVGTIGNAYLVKKEDEFYFKDGNLTWFSQYTTDIQGQYLYTWLNTRQASLAIENIKIGSTQQAITISALNKIYLVKPKGSIVELYNDFRKKNLEKKNILTQETITLTKLRDTLLPKLLSGELRIPDAEKLIENAII